MGRYLRYFLVFVFIIALIFAGVWLYRRISGTSTPDIMVGNSAKTACLTDCSNNAQCGTTIADNTIVVLTSNEPNLEIHDNFVLNGVEVNVIGETVGKIVYKHPDGTETSPEDIKFWRIQEQNSDKPPGWVADWCIEPVN